MITPQQLIKEYSLQPHPEGGWYKETYRSNESVLHDSLPKRFGRARVFSTAIYFLLEHGSFSAFHSIKSDECWHFYLGDPLHIYIIHEDGKLELIHLGNNIDKGQVFQYVVPANCWFASIPAPGSEFCFVGCTVSPGFDFDDFALAESAFLKALYPQHETIINQLCRQYV